MQQTARLTALTASALALGLIATSASAAIATSGIASTRHNLGSSNRLANGLTTPSGLARASEVFTTGTDEICVFCHTPHAASTATVAPLWNKALPNSANYTVYSSGTMQGTSNMNGAASLACLSCHDGTQAMDNMINAPGGNGYAAAGSSTWNLAGGFCNCPRPGPDFIKFLALLGTDLSDDHPVGIPYCGGGQTASASKAGCKDQDFHPAVQAGTSITVGASPVQKENMRLYGSTLSSATVECASCHDPHNDVNKTFLRISNTGSAVCLTCHAK